jgi:hypothetical protein
MPTKKTRPALKAVHTSDEDYDEQGDDVQNLSKAERRRLRKEQRRRKAA